MFCAFNTDPPAMLVDNISSNVRSLTAHETDFSLNFMNMVRSTNKTLILEMTDKEVNMTR
jgi:hypothetical protein